MFPLSLKNAPGSKSFLWTFPECPVRIHINLQFIERLSKEILGPAPAEREAGGLLIGNELSPNGDIEVSDHFQLPPGPESTKNFTICSEMLAKSIKTASTTQGRVIGFYRTHLDQRVQLRPEDLECARSKFTDPMNVFLLIRPRDGRATAAFFYWQDGAVNGGLTFPFSGTELKSSSWTTLVGGSPRPSRLHGLLMRAKERARETGPGVRIGLVVLVAILVAAAGALRFYRPTRTAEIPQTLGLRVERALLGIVVAWNPEAPEIATAKDGDLLIWDGSSPPAFVRLTTAQLRAGRTFLTSFSDRVEIRLDVIGAAGRARTESIVSVSHVPDLGLPAPPATTSPLAAKTPKAKEGSSPKQPVERAKAAPSVLPPAPETAAPVAPEEQASGSFQTAVPIRETKPEIPPELRSLIQSDNVVEVQVSISALGKVTAAKLASMKGPVAESLSKSALDAALAWQFRPATQNGEAVPSDKILEFLFRPSTR